MDWLRVWLWNWIFKPWAYNANEAMLKFQQDLRKQQAENSNGMQREYSVFMQDLRECMRKDAQKPDESERRHKELIAAIESLKRQ